MLAVAAGNSEELYLLSGTNFGFAETRPTTLWVESPRGRRMFGCLWEGTWVTHPLSRIPET